MTIPNFRVLNGAAFLACTGMMAYALYAEHQMLLEPCPLCVFERLAIIALGLVFLVSALHNPNGWGRRVYALIIGLTVVAGGSVASRHIWLQNLPPDQVPSCGPGFDYIIDSFPMGEALSLIFTGSGECATVKWLFLGLSMPSWVLICLVFLGGFGIWVNMRKSA